LDSSKPGNEYSSVCAPGISVELTDAFPAELLIRIRPMKSKMTIKKSMTICIISPCVSAGLSVGDKSDAWSINELS
jgi:hypothetical protein